MRIFIIFKIFNCFLLSLIESLAACYCSLVHSIIDTPIAAITPSIIAINHTDRSTACTMVNCYMNPNQHYYYINCFKEDTILDRSKEDNSLDLLRAECRDCSIKEEIKRSNIVLVVKHTATAKHTSSGKTYLQRRKVAL